jgi:CHAT domain-containing protein/Tfp pilus assembly protein PilF
MLMPKRLLQICEQSPRRFHQRCLIYLFSFLLSVGPASSLSVTRAALLPQTGPGSINKSEVGTTVDRLEPGTPVEKKLAGGELHTYEILLNAGQFLHVVVDQRGIDVLVTALRPDRKQILEIDSPNGAQGPEPVLLIAEESGGYRLTVRSLEKGARAGSYEIRVEELRDSRPEDLSLVHGEKAMAEADRLRVEGTVSAKRKSIEKYLEALPLLRATSSRKREAVALNSLGVIYDSLGEKPRALDYFNQSLEVRRALGDRAGEAVALNNIGLVYNSLGEKLKALEYMSYALSVVKSLGDRAKEAAALNNIGTLYDSLGEKRKAIDYYNQALAIMKAIGDRVREAIALNNIGLLYNSLGEKLKALDYLNQALPVRKAAGDRAGEAATLSNIGLVYSSLGEMQKALDYFNQALPIMKAAGHRAGEAITLNNIGMVYNSLGEKLKALDYFNQALPLRKAVGDRAGEAVTLNNIGTLYDSLGEKQKALDHLNQALPVMRSVGDRAGEASTLSNFGLVYNSLGEKQKALDYYNQALLIAETIGDPVRQSTTLNNIGMVYDSLGERLKAMDYYNRVLPMAKATGNSALEANTLFNMARAERGLGHLSRARSNIETSLAIIESVRVRVAGPESRSSFLASVEQYYEFYIDLLMDSHRLEAAAGHDRAAFEVAERARARSLLEGLVEARADIRKGVDPSLLNRERSLRSLLDGKMEHRIRLLGGRHTVEQAAEVTKEVESLVSQYRELQSQIRAKSPRYVALTQPQPLSLAEIQRQALDRDALLLEYSLGDERSYLWAVTQNSLMSFELPCRDEIEASARRVYDLLTAPSRSYKTALEKREALARADLEYEQASVALSRVLLGPVAGHLAGKRLLIVAEGALQYVPFGALPVPGPVAEKAGGKKAAGRKPAGSRLRPLIADHEIVSLPSASALAVLRRETEGRKPAPKLVAVIADPVFDKSDSRLSPAAPGGKHKTEPAPSPADAARGSILPPNLQQSLDDLGIGDGRQVFTRLPFTRIEARSILAASPVGMAMGALDFDANKANATSPRLNEYRILHFATHGLLNNRHPELSGLVLSLVDRGGEPQDGFLRLDDIYNMNLSADLVVLSACQTALGKDMKREGIIGLTRGFMYAGSARVMASLWKVDDDATSQLMKHFYDGVLRKQMTPAAALRSAELAMWKAGVWRSPFYWAGFVIYGEWK